MNFTPYEMTILLQVHSGIPLSAIRSTPLFRETVDDFIQCGLLRAGAWGSHAVYEPGPKLAALMQHVLEAPRPLPAGQREPLTDKQYEIFVFLMEHLKAKHVAPTQREIAAHFGFASPNAAQEHLQALNRKGYIELQPGKVRAIRCIP